MIYQLSRPRALTLLYIPPSTGTAAPSDKTRRVTDKKRSDLGHLLWLAQPPHRVQRIQKALLLFAA